MSIKIGHASIDERGKASGGVAGDSTTKEVCTRPWYNGNWNVVLRPKNTTLAEKSAKACEAACANNKIGYDQGQRNTLYAQAKAVNFDLSKIKTACETDCSALMHVCAIAGGANLTYSSNGLVTWNMVDAFVKTGQYEKLTASKYLTSDSYLKRGDILVRESGHTAMVLENGSQNTVKNKATVSVELPILRKGDEGESVEALQILLNGKKFNCGEVDGKFGIKTETALKNYQKANNLTVDGVAGTQVWNSILK